ncbi:MAG: RNA 2',3'-cyclic phosphodiesterase [Pseudomonadota bacterium]
MAHSETNREQIRAFVALQLPDNVCKFLGEISSILQQSRADVKWTRANSIHITLKFLGSVDVSRVSEIERVLETVCSSQTPFFTSIAGLGAFPNLVRPRVIWAGLIDGSSHLERIAQLMDMAFENLGFKRESRAYSPHLTLGRTKSDQGRERLVDLIQSLECEGPSFKVDRATLFQSILSPIGPTHIPLSIFNFGK